MLSSVPSVTKWPELPASRRAIVVVDVVESVRLMQAHEADVIERWRRFVAEIRTRVLPGAQGRMVKSLGDGMLLEFESVPKAADAALELHRRIAAYNEGLRDDAHLLLRIGAHVAHVVQDVDDIYGVGVNLAARLAALAGPQETVVSAEFRDELIAGLDADLEDLGDCYLKHLDGPVRVFRIGPPGARPLLPGAADLLGRLRASLAVLPFRARRAPENAEMRSIGDLLADGVIGQLARSPALRVMSRLSTSAFGDRPGLSGTAGAKLGADYIVGGWYRLDGQRLHVDAELARVKTHDVVWSGCITGSLSDLFEAGSDLVLELAAEIAGHILQQELEAVTLEAPATLQSYTLQLGAVSLMHRSAGRDFARVRELLEHLIERHPRLAVPRAYLAKWYVLRVTRGLVSDPTSEAALALEQTRRALDADPRCTLALAMQGFVRCHMMKDPEGAMAAFEDAIGQNASDSWAWLFKGVVHSLWGQGSEALEAAAEALRLAPLDPLRHYYDALAAPAALAAHRYELAIDFAQRSLKVNRQHSPTLRALAIAQCLRGQIDEARATVGRLLELDPGLTVAAYLERSPAGANETRRVYADALGRAGVPVN